MTVTWSFVMHTLAGQAALMMQGFCATRHYLRMGSKEMLFVNATFIIADSAYPLRNLLITPFRNTGHLTPRQHRFNRRLSSARQIVERCYGHLKGRFRRLREITVRKPPHIIAIIISGCILHNLCVLSHDDVEDFIDEDHDVDANFYPNIYLDGGCGAARRNEIMNALL